MKMASYHRNKSVNTVHVFNIPNAMPRYYRDKIFVCPAHRKCLQMLALMYTAKNPQTVSRVEHDKLLKKLQRKMK